jgi:hypothetical protein
VATGARTGPVVLGKLENCPGCTSTVGGAGAGVVSALSVTAGGQFNEAVS